MNLFTIIPANFFSLLASKNKDIYAVALLALHKSLEDNELVIKKNEFIRTLKDKYNDLIFNVDINEEETDQSDDEPINHSDKAAFIVRRLEECGWIDVEVNQDNFEEYIALPSYSIAFLTLINDLVKQSDAEYVSLVHATYTELKLEDELRDEFMYSTLVRTFENTKKLKIELITLGHSIRIFQNRLGKVFSTNNILSDYFDDYKTRVSDRYYHPLKTFDSVAKFKRPIVHILQSWLYDDEARKQLVTQSLMWSRSKDPRAAEQDIIAKINYVTDMYEQLVDMIAQIDTKHQEYTKASANKILYLNNNDRTIKGHLDNIFKTYAEYITKDQSVTPLLNTLEQSLNFSSQGYVIPDSLTLPVIRRYREEGEPLRITDFDDVSDMLMQGFLDETRNQFSNERIFDFMDVVFGDESEIHVKDISLPDFDAFLLLIMATIKTNDEQCFYNVEIDEGKIISQGYRLPNLRFIRKELEA